MDCNEKSDREIVQGIITMLFSFAAMAERAANRPYFFRCYMLWILRRAEVSARRCVGLDAPRSWVLHRNSRQDALDLAAALRDLAHFLQDELREDDLFASWWARGDSDVGQRDPFAIYFVPPPANTPSRPVRAVSLGIVNPAFGLQACRVSPPP